MTVTFFIVLVVVTMSVIMIMFTVLRVVVCLNGCGRLVVRVMALHGAMLTGGSQNFASARRNEHAR